MVPRTMFWMFARPTTSPSGPISVRLANRPCSSIASRSAMWRACPRREEALRPDRVPAAEVLAVADVRRGEGRRVLGGQGAERVAVGQHGATVVAAAVTALEWSGSPRTSSPHSSGRRRHHEGAAAVPAPRIRRPGVGPSAQRRRTPARRSLSSPTSAGPLCTRGRAVARPSAITTGHGPGRTSIATPASTTSGPAPSPRRSSRRSRLAGPGVDAVEEGAGARAGGVCVIERPGGSGANASG